MPIVAAGAGHTMVKRLSVYWRALATGLSFLAFGVGGLILRILVFPAINLFVEQGKRRISLARSVIRHAFRLFIWWMQTLGVLRYEIIGRQRLERGGLLILANHPTLIDTVFLMAFIKHADCIVKGRLWDNPFTRGPVRAAGYINNDLGINLVNDCIASLQSGNNLIVFPEGTRTPYTGVITMKRGAANIAVRGARNITPVVIHCEPLTLGKGDKWWRVPASLVRFRIDVREDIKIDSFIADGSTEVMAARRLTAHLENYFSEESRRHA
jgi:1-acyl-sn-glycerol-3-phosphate acyltransferase